jgi:hypothetical protein
MSSPPIKSYSSLLLFLIAVSLLLLVTLPLLPPDGILLPLQSKESVE